MPLGWGVSKKHKQNLFKAFERKTNREKRKQMSKQITNNRSADARGGSQQPTTGKKERSINPPLPLLLRLVILVAFLLLIAAGVSLFLLPDFARAHWAWQLTPFNTRFLGAIYLAGLVPITMLLLKGRSTPTRLVIAMLFVFATNITLVSFFYLDRFIFARKVTGIWFWIYITLTVIAAYYLPRYRNLSLSRSIQLSSVWRTYLWLQAIVLGMYGLGLIIAPSSFSAFWPWKLDNFHAQLYSSIFLTGAVGSLILSSAAAKIELLTLGLTQAVFGLLVIVGIAITDLSLDKIDWYLPGTWLWFKAFAVLSIAGILIMWHSLQQNSRI